MITKEFKEEFPGVLTDSPKVLGEQLEEQLLDNVDRVERHDIGGSMNRPANEYNLVTCSICGEKKHSSLFGKRADRVKEVRSACKKCSVIQQRNYNRTVEGLIRSMYHRQKASSKRRGHIPPAYTKKELYTWVLLQSNFEKLYVAWELSGYEKDLVPSCDREDDYLPYTLANIELKTWKENNEKGKKDKISGKNRKCLTAVRQYTLEGIFLQEFYSITEASRVTGIGRKTIERCSNGTQISGKGFIWKR